MDEGEGRGARSGNECVVAYKALSARREIQPPPAFHVGGSGFFTAKCVYFLNKLSAPLDEPRS